MRGAQLGGVATIAALLACGPSVSTTGTDEGGASASSTSSSTAPNDSSGAMTSGGEASGAETSMMPTCPQVPCSLPDVCEDGVCVDPGCQGDQCRGTQDYCRAHENCGASEFCDVECLPATPIPICDDRELGSLRLGDAAHRPAVDLQVFDADGDGALELLWIGEGGAQVLTLPEAVSRHESPGAFVAGVAYRADADPGLEISLARAGSTVSEQLDDASAGFASLGSFESVTPLAMFAVDSTADGLDEFVLHHRDGVLHVVECAGTPDCPRVVDGSVQSIDVGAVAGQATLALHDESGTQLVSLVDADAGPTPVPEVASALSRLVALADMTGDGRDDLAGVSVISDSLLVTVWPADERGALQLPFYWSIATEGRTHTARRVARGRIDDDASEDLVIATNNSVWVVFGDPGVDFGVGCVTRVDLQLSASASVLTVGDVDGDGRDEVLVGDGESRNAVLSLD